LLKYLPNVIFFQADKSSDSVSEAGGNNWLLASPVFLVCLLPGD
jgi:hypothetical protein